MSFLDAVLDSRFTMDDCPNMGPFAWHNIHPSAAEDEALVDPNRVNWASQPTHLSARGARTGLESTTGVSSKLAKTSGAGALVVADQGVTADPLESAAKPTSSVWECAIAAPCAVPASIPKEVSQHKKGTTTLGFQFNGGIILAVDSRASSGQYVASQTVQKVIEINDFLLGTMAGGAADCQYWERVLGMECRLWELRNNGARITIAAASKILANITYSYRGYGLSMGTMVAGWDKFGPSLYYIDDQGTRIKHSLFSVGSGSIYAYGVLDSGFRNDLTNDEACELARKSIFHATFRDGASGGFVTVYHIHKNGWTKISRDDQTLLAKRYLK